MTRRPLRLLHEYVHDHDPFPRSSNVNCPGDAIAAYHAHLPQPTLEVSDVWRMNAFKAVGLDERDNAGEAGAGISRQRRELAGNRLIQDRDRPAHSWVYTKFAIAVQGLQRLGAKMRRVPQSPGPRAAGW